MLFDMAFLSCGGIFFSTKALLDIIGSVKWANERGLCLCLGRNPKQSSGNDLRSSKHDPPGQTSRTGLV